MDARATDELTDLVLHALAHLEVPGPESLFDREYVRWARRRLPPEATRHIAEDATLLAVLHATSPGARLVHALPMLHRDVDQLVRSARYPLETLDGEDVIDLDLLDALRAVERKYVEILRTDVALCARDYRAARDEVVLPLTLAGAERIAPHLEQAAALDAELAERGVEIALALGARGRAFGDRVVVGVPAPWNDLDPAVPAVVALHERAVIRASMAFRGLDLDERYVRSEHAALCDLARRMSDAPEPLAAAHARWLAGLNLAPLLAAAGPLGLAPPRAPE